MVLVSDAMAAAGSAPGSYTLGDLTLEVGRDRVVRQPGQANFAGSALTMNEAVANFMEYAGATRAQSWSAASVIPRKLLGIAPTREVVIAARGERSLEIVAVLRSGSATRRGKA
jgi:N-acetylglucosamine-6-phosphate deacetylase